MQIIMHVSLLRSIVDLHGLQIIPHGLKRVSKLKNCDYDILMNFSLSLTMFTFQYTLNIFFSFQIILNIFFMY